jgi:hypothetical protein
MLILKHYSKGTSMNIPKVPLSNFYNLPKAMAVLNESVMPLFEAVRNRNVEAVEPAFRKAAEVLKAKGPAVGLKLTSPLAYVDETGNTVAQLAHNLHIDYQGFATAKTSAGAQIVKEYGEIAKFLSEEVGHAYGAPAAVDLARGPLPPR